MADQKISQLNSLLGANTASGDLVTVVDISDTTMGASGTNKKMTLAEFQASPVSAGTANGVLFLNGTKVPTSGSGLQYNGSALTLYSNVAGLSIQTALNTNQATITLSDADNRTAVFRSPNSGSPNAAQVGTTTNHDIAFLYGNTEQMRLTSTGLGIGTASPASRLHSYAGTGIGAGHAIFGDSAIGYWNFNSGGSPSGRVIARGYDSSAVEQIRLDPSGDSFLLGGNLGIGTASPLAKLHVSTSGVGYELSPNSAAAGNGTLIESYSRTGSIYVPIRAIAEYHRWDAAAGERMRLDASGNLGLNTSTFGTSAAGVLSLGTGTAPTTGPADTVQLFSVDRSAGNTIPAIRCEGSGVTNAGITSTAVTNKIAVQVNGTIYYLLATTNAT